MNNQEIYDTVKTHLLAQAAQAADDGRCMYRAADGLKCAAGCLIKDEFYTPAIEGGAVREPTTYATATDRARWAKLSGALIQSGVSRESFWLVREFQIIHDTAPPHNWSGELANLADRLGLTP